jgi:hypothetical protein
MLCAAYSCSGAMELGLCERCASFTKTADVAHVISRSRVMMLDCFRQRVHQCQFSWADDLGETRSMAKGNKTGDRFACLAIPRIPRTLRSASDVFLQ